jgi:hypothetical protein
MITHATARKIGPWLLGLFFIAQAAGVMPLISLHLKHAFAEQQDIAADTAETGGVTHDHHHHVHTGDGQHQHDSADPGDQCCTLHHHLAGVLPISVKDAAETLSPHVVAVRLHSLATADPGLLERPPKLPSFV